MPQDAPTVADALIGTAGDTRIELAAGLYREAIVVEGVSLTLMPQPGAEGQVSWSADLDEDGIADGLALDIRGVQDARPIVAIEGIEAEFTSLTIDSCSFIGGTANEPRALTLEDCEAVVGECMFTDTHSSAGGGAIYNSSYFGPAHELAVRDSTFERCTSGGDGWNSGGGAIWTRLVSIERSTFLDCTAVGDGGAVYAEAQGKIDDCVLVGNETTGMGGAVSLGYSGGGSVIRNSTFRSNSARGGSFTQGGALSGSASIVGCLFEYNTAEFAAGAVVMSSTSPNQSITDCVFVGNAAVGDDSVGGAICIESGVISIEGSTFARNTASSGGELVAARGAIDVSNSLFVTNMADEGSAASNVRSLQGCLFIANQGNVLVPQTFPSVVSHSVFLDNVGASYTLNIDSTYPYTPFIPSSSVFGPGQSVVVNGDRPTTPLTACIGDPLHIGLGAINLDPMFTRWPSDGGDGWGDDPLTHGINESLNDDYGDLTPLPGSPLIDAAPLPADPVIDMPEFDMAGHPRVHDDQGIPTARPDIGPFEFQGVSCLVDVNRDGLPTPADMNAWIDAFNARGPLGDQNRDGAVTPADYHAWIINFNASRGAGCP